MDLWPVESTAQLAIAGWADIDSGMHGYMSWSDAELSNSDTW